MTLITCPRCGRQVAGGRFCPGCGARLDDPLAGKVLGGKWKLVSPAGKGPFFATYRAEPKAGGVPVMVKVLDPALAEDDGRRRRFLENAGAALSLTDRRLLAVREMAEEPMEGPDGKPRRAVYAVADAPGGPSLADVVAKQGPVDPARAAACVKGVLEALATVHAAGLVHGDLHPGCIYLEPDGTGREQVRLADAGLAPGIAKGDPEAGDPGALGSDGGRWISPEQASGQAPGSAADLHAAGAILHFALTGVPPWQAERGTALLFEIQRSFPRPPSETRPGIPAALDGVVDRALAKGPRERYASAAEFARALGAAASGVALTPVPALPDDVTPGAVMLGGTSAGGEDATVAAPRASLAPPDATMTAVSGRPAAPSGDETLIGPARAPAARAPSPPAPTAAVPRSPVPARQVPPPAGKPAAAKAAAPAQRPAAKPAPASAAAQAAAPAGKPAKVRGAWSVGTPVAVFSILGFLAVGGLYGVVWAGYLDWDIPPWVRVLTGRDEIPHKPEALDIPAQARYPLTVIVQVPPEISDPMEGEGATALYGRWRLVKDPSGEAAPAAGEGAAENPNQAAEEKVWAHGDLRGPLDPTGAISVPFLVPRGKYRMFASLRYGDLKFNEITVEDGPKTFSSSVVRHPTRLVVKVRQELGTVTMTRLGIPHPKVVTGETKAAEFGLASDKEAGRLLFGDKVAVKVEADGYVTWENPAVVLKGNPELVEVDLQKNPGKLVDLAVQEIERTGGLPARFVNDPAVEGHPRVKIALALKAAARKAWAMVESYVEDLRTSVTEGTALPAGTEDSFATLCSKYVGHLLEVAAEAAQRGDVEGVRHARARARLEALGPSGEAAQKARWAELEVQAWLAFPPSAAPPGSPAPAKELTLVERMVEEDLRLAGDANRDRLRKEVARRVLEHRAWPAWQAGNELRPAREGERPPIPGPAVQPWLLLARSAYPDIVRDAELHLSLQRLEARMEDLERSPDRVVALLAGDPQWGPGKPIPLARLDALTKKDKLLLARALARWGDQRQAAAAGDEALRLWAESWNVYQRCFDPDAPRPDGTSDYPEQVAAAARLEGARMALLAKGDDSALGVLDGYLAIRKGDEEARKFRDAIVKKVPLAVPAKMEELKYATVSVPEGEIELGTRENRPETTERPFRDGRVEAVRVGVLPARVHLVREFLVGIREVTWGQYRAYLEEMKDAAKAARLRHPDEPPEKMKPDARRPERSDGWSDAEPVRGVDWWDAYACSRFLGGRLPTEAEWEKAARWCGRRTPEPDPMPDLRQVLKGQWTASEFWPDVALSLGPFDAAPCGARGFWGGVAEWTLDRFDSRAPGVKDGTVDSLAEIPPELKAGDRELMAVRGGSYYHRAPGEAQGESLVEKAKEPPPAAPAPGTQAPPERPTSWRAMDVLERRGIPASIRAKWLGFRVVVSTPASERRR